MNTKYLTNLAKILALILSISCTSSSSDTDSYEDIESWVTQVKSTVKTRDVEWLKKQIDNGELFTLIDVRTRAEHDAGYIPGSVWLPRGLIEFRIGNADYWEEEGLYEPLKDELIILYCRSGNRSALAAEALNRLGYSNVISIDGGFNQWKEIYNEHTEFNLPQVTPGFDGPVVQEEEGGTC